MPCDVAANLRIEVFRAGTGRFTGDGEAVFEHQHAEGQEAEDSGIHILDGMITVRRHPCAVGSCEIVLAGNVGFNIRRRYARCSLAFGLDLSLDGLVVGGHASTSQSSAMQSFTLGTQVLTVSSTFLIAM